MLRDRLRKRTADPQLALAGDQRSGNLRRGEVLGLRWSDIDLRASTLTVNQARVLVEYRVRIEEPKSRNRNESRPRSPESTRSFRAVRNCERSGPRPAIQGLARSLWQDPDL